MNEAPFLALVHRAEEGGGFQTDDVLAALLPLFRQVAAWHEQGRVAPFRGLTGLAVDDAGRVTFAVEAAAPRNNLGRVADLQRPLASALRVVGHARVDADEDTGVTRRNLEVAAPGTDLKQPAFITGYGSWEQEVGHHDTETDVFCAGQLLASLALGLDFTEEDELARFATNRANLFAVNPRLHPVLAGVIVEMTELNRHTRASEFGSLIRRLETYREQPADVDVERLPGFADAGLSDRRRLVQAHLRDRLFEISRRNRLLYFKGTQGTLNLTVSSVPLVMNLSSIRPDQLFYWHDTLAAEIVEGKPLGLGRWLRFEDQPFLPAALDRIIADARRDRAEYGFAQLRLVLAFLHWHNLKETPGERIVSPLLLLPVDLSKKKGVRDQYVLDPTSSEAEVNPVLRHHLHQLYGLELPESIDLRETPLAQFHQDLQRQIAASEPGVTLRYSDKPEIELIHQRASQRLAQFKRRLRTAPQAARTRSSFDYSYARGDLRPLGLQLFREKVLPQPLPQRGAAGGAHGRPAAWMVAEAPPDEGRQTFTLREDRPGNPYAWDFDVCAITLGNFNYRKMSLVRDYGELIGNGHASAAFDRVFSLDPRPMDDDDPDPRPREACWPVVPGDATQAAAVTLAGTGRSFIIQGPPGTGKSQTITNLIADYVARGKRVLFVCEKRAAIDVVFHRLRQQGLDELCCLIHDSQTDKRAFVMNLKQTYETWLAEPDTVDELRARRTALVRQMDHDLASLVRFDDAMRSVPPQAGRPLRELLLRLVELRGHEPGLDAARAEHLPALPEWRAHADLARRLARTLREVSGKAALAAHPFRLIGPQILEALRPLEKLLETLDTAEALTGSIEELIDDELITLGDGFTFAELEELGQLAVTLVPLGARGLLALLDPQSAATHALGQTLATLRQAEAKCAETAAKTLHWRTRLSATDAASARAQAAGHEASLLRFLKPSWWSLKRTIETHYDFSKHAVQPKHSQVVADLEADYAAQDALAVAQREAIAVYGQDAATVHALVAPLQNPSGLSKAARALRDTLLKSAKAVALVDQLAQMAAHVRSLARVLDALHPAVRSASLDSIGEALRDLREEADALPDLVPLLNELATAPPAVAHALRVFDLSPDQIEAAVARRALDQCYRTDRWLPLFDGRTLAHRAGRIGRLERDFFEANAGVIRAAARHTFRAHVQLAATSATQLDGDGRTFKKTYTAGRRDLEHEFGKTMRYKSIRDLAANESGRVIRDLKPIWLMSPLSVSDTLPLAPDLFDVVIFDEASQIPVEEAVPALYRAPQVIVVGDEMQLPPTTFFTAARDVDEETVEVEEDGERVAVALDADSFLTQSARNLPATLLAWHYRSRYESLISFSNAAFYAGNLYTIPDRSLPAPEQPELVVRSPDDAAPHAGALLQRSISFHFMERSPYEDRRNPGEAAYLAALVRELLRRETGRSLGIVAFSEAQQGGIESALEALAEQDADFAARLEAEYTREENDQFCGLFVKNLENVQGDERDIILLSICYGPDETGRMAMNFGPINQRGGEKRLNVIFSRARHHMAVVSSIRHTAITNDYNDGAAALKGYLQFAEGVSRGDLRAARAVLEGLNPLARKSLGHEADRDAVVTQLAEQLRARGHLLDERVGQSRFRCDLAVRATDGRSYALGILVDTAAHYLNPDVAERHVTQPGILRAFGWSALTVLTRDWYHEPEAVLARIERQLRGEVEPEPDDEEELAPPPAEPVAAPPPVPLGPVRRLEFVEGRSAKFWEIGRSGCEVTVTFGRIGTQGQTQTRAFPSEERAAREVEKLVAEKLRKGYADAAATPGAV